MRARLSFTKFCDLLLKSEFILTPLEFRNISQGRCCYLEQTKDATHVEKGDVVPFTLRKCSIFIPCIYKKAISHAKQERNFTTA